MRTSQNKSPLALWEISMMTFDPNIQVPLQQYGIDTFGPIAINSIEDDEIIVPEMQQQILHAQLIYLQTINFLVKDGNHGINHFLQVLNIIST